MSIPIPASETVVVPSQSQVTFDRWAILSQTVTTNPDTGKIALSAMMCLANANSYSNRPQDRVSISDPDIAATAAGDATLGSLLVQRISLDLMIATRLMELRGII